MNYHLYAYVYMRHLLFLKRQLICAVVPNVPVSHFCSGKQLVTLPYKIGIFTGIFCGTMSIPLVCHKPSAVWFNDTFVHCDPPDDGLESLENAWCAHQWQQELLIYCLHPFFPSKSRWQASRWMDLAMDGTLSGHNIVFAPLLPVFARANAKYAMVRQLHPLFCVDPLSN